MGQLDGLNGYSYSQNPDVNTNQHGTELLKMAQSCKMIPLNLLKISGKQFGGGLTFHRGNAASQNDWFLCNDITLPCIRMINLHEDVNEISDHIPISVEFELDLDVSLTQIKHSITDILRETNNHSRKPVIRTDGIIKETFQRLVSEQVQRTDFDVRNPEVTLTSLRDIFYDCANRSRVPSNRQQRTQPALTSAIENMNIAENNRSER